MNDGIRVYYFGCVKEEGHYLHSAAVGRIRRLPESVPFKYEILDGSLLPPNGPQTEGVVHRVRFEGWTVIAFWDRSVDSRPGSCSAFVIEGNLQTSLAIVFARKAFPEVFARFKFEVA